MVVHLYESMSAHRIFWRSEPYTLQLKPNLRSSTISVCYLSCI